MGKPLSSLSLRIISSAVLIPVVVGLVAIGEWFFIGLVGLTIAIALSEWINVARHMAITKTTKIALMVIGVIYLTLSFFEMAHLREQSHGLFWTITFMLCIWASDSVAYLLGKTIGGPKMSPSISPNKTWSGYAGALLGPALILMVAETAFPMAGLNVPTTSSTVVIAFIFGVAFGITGQSGDLMISAMKRKAGLKDTGAIIPGHGGILDRIDALLLALPVFLAYIRFVTE